MIGGWLVFVGCLVGFLVGLLETDIWLVDNSLIVGWWDGWLVSWLDDPLCVHHELKVPLSVDFHVLPLFC